MSLRELMTASDAMMNLSPDGFAIVNADETIAEANDAFCRLLGGRRDNLVGRRLKEIGGIDRVRDAIARHIGHMRVRTGESTVEIEKRVGSSTYLLRMRPVFDSRGNYSATVVAASDISALAHRWAMEQDKSATLGKILQWISRRAKEPVAEVAGAINRLYDTGLSSNQFGRLETARTNVQVIEDLIGQVEDFYRLETGRFALKEEVFDLKKTIRRVVDDLRFVAGQKNVALSARFDETIDSMLRGDEERLRQVIATLVRFVLEHSRAEKIEIGAELVGCSKESFVIRCDVKTPRTDIEQEPEKVFGPGEGTAGAGLELLVARRIVELMGGSIGMHRANQEGDTFWFFARVRPGRTVAPPGGAGRYHAGGDMLGGRVVGVRVLIVDDDVLSQRVLSRILGRYGYAVDSAQGFEDAEKALASTKYHVLILATEIEKTRFDSARRRLEEVCGRAGAPTIVGLQAGPEGRRRAATGAVVTLRKPVRPKELLKTLDKCLSNRLASRGSMADSLSSNQYRREDFDRFEVLDRTGALSRLGGNAELLEELTADFVARTGPGVLARIDAAARKEDLDGLEREAHALCGSAAAVGAVRMSRIAVDVERMCRQGDLEEPQKWAAMLGDAFRNYAKRALETAETTKKA